MAEFKLGRIKFVWKGNWTQSTTYYKDDVVQFGGKTFICAVGHTADTSFYTDLDIVPSKWNQMTDGQAWEGNWTISTLYKVNDVVKYGGTLYICNESHTSAGTTTLGLEDDQGKWDTYVEGFDWKSNWTIATRYKVNDVVKYGGQTYVANTGHTSAGTTADGLELDQAKWDYLNKGTEYKGAWATATRYKVNDVIKYGPNLYVSNTAHTSDATDFATDIANWDQFVEGFAYENTWSNATTYQPGDVVKYGGNHYVSTSIHAGTTPTAVGQSDWSLFSRNFDYIGNWAIDTGYKIGEVVTVGSYTYVATADSPTTAITVTASDNGSSQITAADTTGMVAGMAIQFSGTSFGNINVGYTYFVKTVDSSTTFTISTTQGGSTFSVDTDTGSMTADVSAHPTNTNYFSTLNEGFRNRGDWNDDVEYEIGDVVKFGDNTYVSIAKHRSEGDDGSTVGELGGGGDNSRPDQDASGAYWNQLMTGSETSILTTSGDLVYYGGAGPTRLPIGVEGQVLMAGQNYPEWTSLGGSDHVYYVAPHGRDEAFPVFGKTVDKPFKTIRYACEAVLKGPLNPNANKLLELNRAFIQRETTEWIDYQVANAGGSGIWDSFDYDESKCERDTGFIVDALIHDIGHGGNVRSRGAANTYVGGLFEDEQESYGRLAQESAQSVAAFAYTLSVIQNVLNQTDPSVNYQVTNGDNSTAIVTQYKDATINAESGTYDKCADLMTIISNAVEDGDTTRIPARVQPNNLIIIKTGAYEEVLPIIVPENTCVIGDEVRSTKVNAAGSKTDKTDAKFSIDTFAHLEDVISDVIAGATVTPSASNAETQDIAVPFADTVEQTDITRLIRGLTHDMDFRLGTKHKGNIPDPTGYNISYLVGYGDARKLVKENKDFFIKETTAYITANYPNLKYSKTKCEQDVGYIVDALIYDLTYGGKDQTIKAGLAYFDGRNGANSISAAELVATTDAYTNLKSMISTVAQANAWTALQSAVTVFTDTAGSAASITHLDECLDIIIATVQDANDTPNAIVSDIASNVATTTVAHGMAVGDKFVPRSTANGFVLNRIYYVKTVPNPDEFTVSETFDGSTVTLTNGTGLTITGDIEYRPDYSWASASQITAWTTLSAATETIIQGVVNELATTNWHTDFVVRPDNITSTAFEIYVGTTDLVHTYVNGGTVTKADGTELDITNFVYNESTGIATVTTATHGLLGGEVVDVENIVVSCLSSGGTPQQFTFPSSTSTDGSVTKVKYIQSKCLRDTRIILNSVGYDMMFAGNYNTLVSALSYLRATAKDVYDKNQKETTLSAFAYVKTQAKANVGGNATAQAKIEEVMTLLDDVVYIGSNEGSKASCATDARNAHHAALQLERNRDFIIAEATAYIADTFSDTVTATSATGDIVTISDTSWMTRGMAIEFEGTIVGEPSGPASNDGIEAGTVYYVQNIVSSTTFTISDTRYGAVRTLTTDTGSATVKMSYNSALCERDTGTVIDALKFDIKYPGNYKTRYASRYYANAVIGSQEEDMYYLRNGTGVRNQTVDGLRGDLLPENAYGTSRVSAGAYCSLDPGWGPDDYSAWITERSPYVQNVATFGYAAVGQKIDGALHAGGNDSIVSNDFTQLISDGIGAWVTNNARAELVSVFSYYSHIGYLAENGGRIRGTNGNNSYGDWGSVAEGFDDTETTNTAIVDNKFQFEATVEQVFTDAAEEVYAFEFGNAGQDYTEGTFLVSGAGTGASVEVDDFRDGAVSYVWLEDNVDDSTSAPEAAGNFGGFGYISNSNTAQAGDATSITLAATDGETSTAYIGMKVYIDGGAGVGQFGIIDTYNAGTKRATVTKESTGAAGWDHVLPGTAIATPDASSTYIVEPRISFAAPGFDAGVTDTINTSGNWNKVKFAYTSATYLPSSVTYAGNGSGASFQVIKNGGAYIASILTGGETYERLQTITIDGADLGGATTTNDLTITITSVDTDGEILEFDTEGDALEGKWVAVKDASNVSAYSSDGLTWASGTLPTSADWKDVASAMIDDGSSVAKQSRVVAIASGTAQAAWSNNGTTWNSATMPVSANWSSVTYGEGKFVAVADDTTTVAVSLDGVEWDITGTLPGTGYDHVAYGQGQFIAIESGSTNSATSTDGESWSAGGALPASSTWTGLAYGRNIFIAVANDSTSGAYSIDKGTTWAAMTLGETTLQDVQYGQGMFVASKFDTGNANEIVSSQDGIHWNTQTCANTGTDDGFSTAGFGVKDNTGYWIGIDGAASTNKIVRFKDGATAKGRCSVADNKIFEIRITDPGSGYSTAPTLTVTDPSEIYAVPTEVRITNGAIANPSFTNRGTGYESSSADLVDGDGYAFFYQAGSFIAIRQLTEFPVTGSNVVFGHLPDQTFKLVNILTLRGTNDGSYTCFFQVSPDMKVFNVPDDGVSVETRIRYSQVRLTGHDFLDIGTGNFTETNYPGLPLQEPVQSQETKESNGGRVFFTTTDQDGNFRVGNLFAVEQSTGVATLNADAFNIAGLQELSLGEVTLGGGSASIDEFSTDPFFTQDSDSVVPTQRAIKAFISSQIGGGGASLNVNSVTAGFVKISGTTITSDTGASIQVNATLDFKAGVRGYPLAWNYFLT